MCSCGKTSESFSTENSNQEHIEVIVFDSCEYVRFWSFSSVTHKGNCRHCKKRNLKQ